LLAEGAASDPDVMVSVSDSPKAFDVSDVLHLDRPLPGRSNDDLASEPFVIDRPSTEQTCEDVVAEDLRHRVGR
jgi:hypothetical protein